MTNNGFFHHRLTRLFGILGIIILFSTGCGTGAEKTKSRDISDIGLVQLVDTPLMAQARQGLEDELADRLGTRVHRVRLDWADAGGQPLALKPIIQTFEKENKQVIVTLGSPPLEHAIEVVATVPVVFGVTINPGVMGLNLKYRPAMPNFTGTYAEPPIAALGEFVKILMPDLREVGVVWNPSRVNSRYEMHALRTWCASEGYVLEESRIRRSADLEYATRLLLDKEPQAIFILADDLVIDGFRDLMAPIIRERGIPMFTDMPDLVGEEGADLGWGFDFYLWGRATGRKVVEVLEGTAPYLVSIDRFEQCRLVVHRAGLEKAGLQVPETLLEKADTVY